MGPLTLSRTADASDPLGPWLVRLVRARADVFVTILVFALSFLAFRRAPIQQPGDSRYAMLLAENLLRHGEFALDRYHLPDSEYQIERIRGHQYYSFPPGTSVLSTPLVGLLHLKHLSAVSPGGRYSPQGELKVDAFMAAFVSTAFSVLAYLTARLLLPIWLSVATTAVATFGTQVYSTMSRSMWSDTWGILLVGTAAFLLLRSEARAKPLNLPLLATIEAAAYVVRPTNSLVVAGTAFYLGWTRRRDVWQFLVTVGAWLALFVGYSWTLFRRPVPSYFSSARLHFGNAWTALMGNLVSPGRGMLVYVPAVLAVGLMLLVYGRTVRFRAILTLAAFVVMAHFVVLSGFEHWWGGHCYGARLTGSLVPWVVVAGVIALDGMRTALGAGASRSGALTVAATAGILCVASIAINAIGAQLHETSRWNYAPEDIDQTPQRLWSWRRPQFLAPFIEPSGPFPLLAPSGLRLSGREAEQNLGLGWALQPEDDFRWTDGRSATLRFGLDRAEGGVLDLDLRPYLVAGKHPTQRMNVWLNGHDMGEIALSSPEFARHEIVIPAGVAGTQNVLRLRLPDAVSPAAAEGARDDRVLGVAVRVIRWSRL